MIEHFHDPALVHCVGCGQERWCGIGPCGACGALTPCPQPTGSGDRQ